MNLDIILEGNKLIAKFMGAHENPQHRWYNLFKGDNGYRLAENFEYHSSWDWLMPVVKKINEVDLDLDLWSENNIDRYNLTSALNRVDIDEVFQLCVLYITWYNNLKTINHGNV